MTRFFLGQFARTFTCIVSCFCIASERRVQVKLWWTLFCSRRRPRCLWRVGRIKLSSGLLGRPSNWTLIFMRMFFESHLGLEWRQRSCSLERSHEDFYDYSQVRAEDISIKLGLHCAVESEVDDDSDILASRM